MSAFASVIPLAFGALGRNRMRSLLTSLGVIIGVGALIVTVSSGEGSKAVLEEQLATLGTNLLIVLPGSSTLGGARGGPGTGKPLTHADLLAIVKGASAARYAAPVNRTVVQVVIDNQNWLTTVFGSTPDFFAIREWTVAHGRLFNSSESDSGAKVCVIGQTVATQLFGASDALGQTVRVRAMPCEVVGVLVSKGQSSQGQDQDDLVVMPWKTLKSRMMSQNTLMWAVSWSPRSRPIRCRRTDASDRHIAPAASAVRRRARRFHRTQPSGSRRDPGKVGRRAVGNAA